MKLVIKFNNKISLILLILGFTLFIPVDIINGIFLRNGLPSLSSPYKSMILFLVLVYLLKNNKYSYVFSLIIIISTFIVIHTILLGDISLALSGLDMIVRFIAILIFFLFFSELIKKQHSDYLFTIAFISFCFLAMNVVLGALGFGYGMYGGASENAIGTKGFIFAGNELGGAVIISGAIIMIKNLEENQYLKFFILGIIMLVLSAFMGSKVSILGTIILFFIFPILKAFKNLKNFKLPKKDFYYSNMMLLIVPFLSTIAIFYTLYETNLIMRLTYFYEKVDLVTLIFSGRNIRALEALEIFKNYDFIGLLFGTGRDWWQYTSENKLVELDPLDFLMNYGIFGFLFVFGSIFYFLIKTIKNRKNNPYSIYILFILLLLLAMSFSSGHIFYSGTTGFLIAIVMSLVNYNQRKKINENLTNF